MELSPCLVRAIANIGKYQIRIRARYAIRGAVVHAVLCLTGSDIFTLLATDTGAGNSVQMSLLKWTIN